MKKKLTSLILLLVVAAPAMAQNWSLGVHSGPFIFGDLAKRSLRSVTDQPSGLSTAVLSADTRAGLSVDLERRLADRWALRAEGTFTRAPIAVNRGGGDGVRLDAGDLDVATFSLPLVFRINPRGSFRVHLMAGPAFARYEIDGQPNFAGSIPVFEGSRNRWGAVAGGGVAWWWSERFAVEGNFSDIVTESPFERSDFPNVPGFEIPRPHNVHTTVGVRWSF